MGSLDDRPVYEQITREVIAALPDNLLSIAMFDHIWLKVGGEYEKTLQVLAELPPGFRVVYHIFVLDGEISNGGFNQYFFNRLDQGFQQQQEALHLIGASEHQRVLREAFQIHAQEKQDEELQRRYAEGTIESFFSTYGLTRLETCDEDWYLLAKRLDDLLGQFIRTHPEWFLTEGMG